MSGCTIGKYWNEQGKAPCEDVGTGVAIPQTLLEVSCQILLAPVLVVLLEDIKQVKDTVIMVVQEVATVEVVVLVPEVVKELVVIGGGGGGASGYYSSQVELLSSSHSS